MKQPELLDHDAATSIAPAWLRHYWGKTNYKRGYDLGPGSNGDLQWQIKTGSDTFPLRWHLLAYHNLDVAACGKVLLEKDALLRKRLADGLGVCRIFVVSSYYC